MSTLLGCRSHTRAKSVNRTGNTGWNIIQFEKITRYLIDLSKTGWSRMLGDRGTYTVNQTPTETITMTVSGHLSNAKGFKGFGK